MAALHLSALYTLCIICGIRVLPTFSSDCKVTEERADCSHLELFLIPSDLPNTITILDLSHNRLKLLPAANLSRYERLEYLDVGYNTIHIIDPALCKTLPLLKILILQHNQFIKISEKAFISCEGLLELRLNYNGLKEITGNPFKNLQSLQTLDVSQNKMASMALGDTEQLTNLTELVFSHNLINELKKEDLAFLQNSPVQKLDLSSNPIKIIHPGCFEPLKNLSSLVMANMSLKLNLAEQLCTELANTPIKVLVLPNTQLSVNNRTFKGLASTNLLSLDISRNHLSKINDDSFNYLHSLTDLNLKENQVSHLTSRTFNGLSNVQTLSLQSFFSGSPTIDDLSFNWLKNLEYLNMEKNEGIDLKQSTFTGLTSLKHLILNYCSFKSFNNITFSSLSTSPLISLNLTRTGITKLDYGAFSALEHLEMLDLGLNKIDQILGGDEFTGLSSIKMIYLSYNNHLTLTSNSFRSIPTLEKLNLRKTGLIFKEQGVSPFRGLKNLTVLDLANNNIANLAEDFFDGLQNLQILNLQHNNFARLWKKANPGGPVLFLKSLQNLEILDLLSNGFDEIPAEVFRGLSKLSILDLGENNINLLPPSLFDDQSSLVSLDFHKNLITSVESNTFKDIFQNLKILNMYGNPFDCTCESIAWFSSWLNTTNATVIEKDKQYICNTPINYHGIPVEKFDNAPCKDAVPFRAIFIVAFTLTSCLLFGVLFLEFQGWRIQFYWNVMTNTVFGFRDIDPNSQTFTYDAYIIHAKKDEEWVDKYLIPLEEEYGNRIKFCFEERDFTGGLTVFPSIVQSIKTSRKIIFVITHYFLSDQWCRRFKVHHAFHQAVEQCRDSIILLFLEDIPDYKLSHFLQLRRGMFKSRCILEWPAQKERISAFKQKLNIALGSTDMVN